MSWAADPIEALHDAVDGVLGAQLDAMSDGSRADRLIQMSRESDRLLCAISAESAVAHRRGFCSIDGSPSTAAWLRWKCAITHGMAKGRVDVGMALEELPATDAALRNGKISFTQAQMIVAARIDGEEASFAACEESFVAVAKVGSIRDLRGVLERWRVQASAKHDDKRRYERRGFHLSRTLDGTYALGGGLDAEGGETVAVAIKKRSERRGDDDTRTPGQRRADALVEICRFSLDAAATTATERPHLTVVIDWHTLAYRAPGRADLELSGPISAETARRLACDASISRLITGPDGLPLDVGRSTRTISAAIRRALGVRDGGCVFPGCDRTPHWCDAHHVSHWSSGGQTALRNLVLLCGYHHRLVHEGGFSLKFDGHDLRVQRPDGSEIEAMRNARSRSHDERRKSSLNCDLSPP